MQRAGEPIDREQYAAVEARALRLLARREHSVRELETKLRARAGATAEDAEGPDIVRAVITDLAVRGLVSDARFASAWARDAVRLKPRSARQLVRELVQRGVPPSAAAAAVEAVFAEEGVDDAALAQGVAEAWRARRRSLPPAVAWRRLGARLQRRGFHNALIYDVCAAVLPPAGPDEE